MRFTAEKCFFCRTLELLYKLADRAKLREKIDAMFRGEHLNVTEDRAVLHVALRARRHQAHFYMLEFSSFFSFFQFITIVSYPSHDFVREVGRRSETQANQQGRPSL